MKKLFVLFGMLVLLALVGCGKKGSTDQAEQPQLTTLIKDISGNHTFVVDVYASEGTGDLYKRKNVDWKYVQRAALRKIGNECKSRGYSHFDYGVMYSDSMIGFCFPTSERKALGVLMKSEGSHPNQKVFVEHLKGKLNSSLKVGDWLLSINTRQLKSIADLKLVVRLLADANAAVTIELIRDGAKMTVTESLAAFADGAMGPAELADLNQ